MANIEFVQDDVLHWAKAYSGPPFMAALMDPPYELNFMGRAWDRSGIAFQAETWAALGEHLLPGAFCMAFGGSRTYHRMACAIEDAGFVIHPAIVWCFGSGFPKSTRIDSQIDRAAGAEREVIGRATHLHSRGAANSYPKMVGHKSVTESGRKSPQIAEFDITAPATDLARTWAGHRYGLQAIKPAIEFIAVFQKPYAGRPVDSITSTGAGALWVEGGRVGTDDNLDRPQGTMPHPMDWGNKSAEEGYRTQGSPAGRWPSNLLLDPIAAAALGRQSGVSTSRPDRRDEPSSTGLTGIYREGWRREPNGCNDTGTAARFFQHCDWALEEAEPMFYAAKASRRERDSGLPNGQRCTHPTVKALSLTKYLATLLLPPAEYAPRRILIPFAGVFSEAIGASLAGWDEVVGIEAEEEYVTMGKARAAYWLMQPSMALEAAE